MKNSHRLLVNLVLLLAVSTALRAQVPEAAQDKPKPPLPNYVELSSLIGTGGQPDETGMKQLAEKGYKCIINLRTSGEAVDLAAEEKQARQLGLRYYMVPFSGKEPSEEQALAFNALMSALKEEKVFVHCTIGARVATLMTIYFALEQGMSPDAAEQQAWKIGLRIPELLEFSKRVIEHHKK
ncbi:MAG: protein tyrosine phosphatase family protein [Acidobacteriia bacterium]|nr:protein tyrosine phosphatase family protein [Terriglobia bacterium]